MEAGREVGRRHSPFLSILFPVTIEERSTAGIEEREEGFGGFKQSGALVPAATPWVCPPRLHLLKLPPPTRLHLEMGPIGRELG